ncbi:MULTISPECIES: hypothetical protein [Thermocrispum]|uniref:Uncharacterized protein n=1 Tax=Thermocrispum agreste TaxID=37925 RepID=A0A2W4JL37_9PSEU|nr:MULTISPECIES: hypothetical protein [Thermocrispum]PZM98918.1 MAG: hypothetical protein DIU77_06925 [Thermocrispum agreste]
MTRGTSPTRATRVAGGTSLLVAVLSAAALTGAAFVTVDLATCGQPARYVHNEQQIELVGGCIDTAKLPTVAPGPEQAKPTLSANWQQP